MKRTPHALLSVVPLVMALGACSGSSADAEPKYSSGVDGNLGLGNLTSAQQTTICTSQAAFVRAHVDTTSITRFWCAFTPAVVTAKDDASCQSAMDACVTAFSVDLDVTVTDPNAPPPQCMQVNTSSCTGTVSEYEGCVDSLANVEISIGTDWACGKRTQYPSSPTVGVDACKALGPTCTAVTGAPPEAIH